MEEVATLTTETIFATFSRVWRRAASVSAVSPDWLTKSAMEAGDSGGSR